jgi:hypothetical protein
LIEYAFRHTLQTEGLTFPSWLRKTSALKQGEENIMHWTTRLLTRHRFLFIAACLFLASPARAQITNILFFEDFETPLNTNELVPAAPFFEGGVGDIHGTVANGVVEFTGTVSQQWWAGATLRVVPTFTVSDANQVAVEVDRVLEDGQGTASRSALWIMDSTQNNYVLFADVRGEQGWRYNRKIGVAGDNPTGGGTEVTAWNDAEDGALHVMKAIANGQNVRLYLDDRPGPTIRFPFTNLVFHIGSYARANGDTAFTQFDNLRVYSIGTATFEPTNLTVSAGQTLSNIVVRIPPGLNATSPVQLRVVSSAPTLAIPVGAVGDTLTLTFAAGATNTQTISVASLGGLGGARLTLTNTIGLQAGNSLNIAIISGPGLRLQDDFASATLDAAKWEQNDASFEVGTGVYEVAQSGGRINLSGVGTAQYWGGVSIRSVPTFTATKDLPLVVEVDRVGINRLRLDETESTAGRSSLWLATTNRAQYIVFSQNLGENGWQVNLNNTGAGTDLPEFNDLDTSTNTHRMKLVANGETVEVYLDGEFGGRFDFPVNSGLHAELGAYTRDIDDQVNVAFDNLRIENSLPCITFGASELSVNLGQNNETVAVTIPRLLNAGGAVPVTVTSRNPAIAVPAGAVNGTLTLNFGAGATNQQSFAVQTVGLGATTFDVAAAGACSQAALNLTVTAAPQLLFADAFTGTTLSNKWVVEATPLGDGGTATAESGVIVSNGAAVITVTAETASWPGFAVYTADSFNASVTQPAIFEIDREKLNFTLVTGTGAKQRTGMWITDTNRSRYVFFSEFATHDGTAGGWQYHRSLGAANDIPVSGTGVSIPAFGEARFNDRGSHRLRAVANGQTVKLYMDGTLGAEVDFPVSQGIVFGFAAYVLAATDVAAGVFDDVNIYGSTGGGGTGPSLTAAKTANGDITISWNAPGTLQFRESLAPGGSWANVSPAPAGTSYTIPRAGQGTQRFFRVVQ